MDYFLSSRLELFTPGLSSPLFPNDSIPTKMMSSLMEEEQIFFDGILNFKINASKETRFLVEFAVKIGLYITFIMLKAIRPQFNEKTKAEKMTGSDLWTKYSISSNLILFHFIKQDIVRRRLLINQSRLRTKSRNLRGKNTRIDNKNDEKKTDNQIDKEFRKNDSISNYEVDENTYQSLEDGFKAAWPYTFIMLSHLQKEQNLDTDMMDLIKSCTRAKLGGKKKPKKGEI